MKDSDQWDEKVDAYFDDGLSPAEVERLEAQLLADEGRLRRFAREAFFHRQLQGFLSARRVIESLENTPAESAAIRPSSGAGRFSSKGGKFTRPVRMAVIAASLLICGAIFYMLNHQPRLDPIDDVAGSPAATQNTETKTDDANNPPLPAAKSRRAVARLTRVWKPEWSDPKHPLGEWSELDEGQTVDLISGQAEVFFEAGVQVVLQGPVRFQVLGPKSGRVFHGDLTARVGENAKGFSLVTAVGRVIDLGTEFGMSVQPDGLMDVVVFDGTVDLEHRFSDKSNHASKPDEMSQLSRLTTGEAVRIEPDGTARRIVSVDSSRFSWAATGKSFRSQNSSVISSVDDNIRSPGVGPFYEIVHGGLDDDARAYVDRPHEWNGVDPSGIPPFLLGADYIKTFNDDKNRGGLELAVELAQPADLYVFWDTRVIDIPDWLRDGFTEMDVKIGLDEASYRNTSFDVQVKRMEISPGKFVKLKPAVGPGNSIDVVYSIWHQKVLQPGIVKLGPTSIPKQQRRRSMYAVAAVALKEANGNP